MTFFEITFKIISYEFFDSFKWYSSNQITFFSGRSFRIFPKMRGEISVLLTDFAKRSVNGGQGGGSETSSLFCQCSY